MRDLSFDINARDKTGPAFNSARRNAGELNTDLDRTGRLMSLAGTAAKAFVAGFSVAAVSGFARAMHTAVTEAADLVDLSDKLGVSLGDLQRIHVGFADAGIEASAVDRSLEQWSKRIAEAANGGGRLLGILQANGLALRDSSGQLRSSVDLMRDYADLVKNAASDQERILLSTIAFGSAGDEMVLALRDGGDGFDRLMRLADETGGVIEDDVLRRAAEIDDEFNAVARTVELNVKSALLGAASIIDDMADGVDGVHARLSKFGNSDIFRKAAQWLGAIDENGNINPDSGLLPPPNNGRTGRVGNQTLDQAQGSFDEAFALWKRSQSGGTTIIPDNDNGTRKRDREPEISDYERVIEKLREENELLGLNEVQQRVLTEQRRAGVTATSQQGQAIEQLVTQIEAETARMERLEDQQRAINDAVDYFASAGLDALFAWAEGAASAEEAAKRLGQEILKAVTYGALLGQGPLGGLFGSGLLGNLFGGFRAEGGTADPWKSYVVGEKGPEILQMGPQGGRVVANDDAFGGGGQNVHVTVGVAADNNGNLMPFVESVSRRQAAGVVQAATPGIVSGSVSAVQSANRNRPGFMRG